MKKTSFTYVVLFLLLLPLPLTTTAYGGTLSADGYHDLPLVMEEVPSSWPQWQINEDHMWLWNHYMDIYRSSADDGSWGNNDENEFTGFPTSAQLNDQYGFGWGAGWWAVTWTEFNKNPLKSFRLLVESDISFNPAFRWV